MGGIGYVVKKIFGANKNKEEAQQQAATQSTSAQNVASAALAELAARIVKAKEDITTEVADIYVKREEDLQALADDYATALAEIAKIETKYESKYRASLVELNSWRNKAASTLKGIYVSNLDKEQYHVANLANYLAQANSFKQQQHQYITNIATKLQQQILEQEDKSIAAFAKLLAIGTTNSEKVELHSFIVSKLKTNPDSTRVRKFIYDLSFSTVDITEPDAITMCAEVYLMLSNLRKSELNVLVTSKIQDQLEVDAIDSSSIELANASRPLRVAGDLALGPFRLAITKLEQTVVEQESKLYKQYNDGLKQIEKQKKELSIDYKFVKSKLTKVWEPQIALAEEKKLEAFAKLDADAAKDKTEIQAWLSSTLEQIASELEENNQRRRKKFKNKVLNITVSIGSFGAACFVTPLASLLKLSSELAASLQTSLVITGAGALANILNHKDRAPGISLQLTVPVGGGETKSEQGQLESITVDKFKVAKLQQEYNIEMERLAEQRQLIQDELYAKMRKPVFLLPQVLFSDKTKQQAAKTKEQIDKEKNRSLQLSITMPQRKQHQMQWWMFMEPQRSKLWFGGAHICGFSLSGQKTANVFSLDKLKIYGLQRDYIGTLKPTIFELDLKTKQRFPLAEAMVGNSNKGNLLSRIKSYKREQESYVGAFGRVVDESGFLQGWEYFWSTVGEAVGSAIKLAVVEDERRLRKLAIKLGFDVDCRPQTTERLIVIAQAKIAAQLESDVKGMLPLMKSLVAKYNITEHEVIAARTALEVYPFARLSKVASIKLGTSLQQGIGKAEQTFARAVGDPLLFSRGAGDVLEAGRQFSASPYAKIKTRDPLKPWTIKERIKSAQLPVEGKVRFVPDRSYKSSRPILRGKNHGYVDRFGNEWIKGPSRTSGEFFEWDVRLSELGKKQLGWLSRDGKHINVSLKGRITHD